jgi:hypothetical protein
VVAFYRKKLMRSSSPTLASLESHSWLDPVIAIFICILAVGAPIVLSIVVTPHYEVNQVADTFPGSSWNL